MAVSSFPRVLFQPFPLPPTEGMPQGIFGASASLTGDATGGNSVIGVLFETDVPANGLILQYDSVIIQTGNATLKAWTLVITEGGLYVTSLSLGGGFMATQLQDLRPLEGYIQYPNKAVTSLLTFTTTNVDTIVEHLSVRGRYWDRSYLRQTGQTPKFL